MEKIEFNEKLLEQIIGSDVFKHRKSFENAITSNDLNDVKLSGTYVNTSGQKAINSPVPGFFILIHFEAPIVPGTKVQIIFDPNSYMFFRIKWYGANYYNWRRVTTTTV